MGALFVFVGLLARSREEGCCVHLMTDILLILAAGLLAGELASRLGLPRLVGMIVAGALLGPDLADLLSADVGRLSPDIRMLALVVILLKAGLGLDRGKIAAQGWVAVRLGFMPAVIEASVVATASRFILGWDWAHCWLLGWIVCAASPAVIVPMMLHLKSRGWGTDKGIPDLILAGGTMSDATALTMFGVTLSWVVDGPGSVSGWTTMAIPLEVVGGLGLGWAAARLAHWLLRHAPLAGTIAQDLVVVSGLGLALVVGGRTLPYSGLLAVMVMGFCILESDRVLARRLRTELEKVWTVAQVFLFVLIGAAVNPAVVSLTGFRGVAVIMIGLVLGRWLGIMCSTLGSNITFRERVFMVVGDMAKATVQAAIGGIPLAMGIAHGEEILALAVLSILLTAPLGAIGTALLAPRMLTRGPIDPTRVTVLEHHRFLVAVDGSDAARRALLCAASIARRSDAELVLVHVSNTLPPSAPEALLADLDLIGDVPHSLEIRGGVTAETIVAVAEDHGVDFIFIGKQNRRRGLERILVGDVAQQVTHTTDIPVILVGDEPGRDEPGRDEAASSIVPGQLQDPGYPARRP